MKTLRLLAKRKPVVWLTAIWLAAAWLLAAWGACGAASEGIVAVAGPVAAGNASSPFLKAGGVTYLFQALVHQPSVEAQAREWGVTEFEALGLVAADRRPRTFDAPPAVPGHVTGETWHWQALPDGATLLLLLDARESLDAPGGPVWLAARRQGDRLLARSSRPDPGRPEGWRELAPGRAGWDVWTLAGQRFELEVLHPGRVDRIWYRCRPVGGP